MLRRFLLKCITYKKDSGSLIYALLNKFNKYKFPRKLLITKNSKYFNHSVRRINRIMNGKEFSYLEIGVANGTTLESVKASEKHAVDPFPTFNTRDLPSGTHFYKSTSDNFFSSLEKSKKFDFIFLDGLHEFKQLARDFTNALQHINNPGWILIDDIVPSDSISAIPSIELSYKTRGVEANEGFPWHGDCYKILPIILNSFPNIQPYLIIYPDNPQLLLKITQPIDNTTIDQFETPKLFEYSQVFSSKNLKTYPVYIEDLLMNELSINGSIE